MIDELTDEIKYKAKKRADEYYKAKEIKPTEAILGFIKRNGIFDKDNDEIDALIETAKRLSDGAIMGEGDKFKVWCQRFDREQPSDDLVWFMNGHPFEAKEEIRGIIPEHPKLWRAYCTYLAGRGRHSV